MCRTQQYSQCLYPAALKQNKPFTKILLSEQDQQKTDCRHVSQLESSATCLGVATLDLCAGQTVCAHALQQQ